MTAIGAVIAPWGVLMAADGRMTSDDCSDTKDDVQKLFSIVDPGRTLVYALAGSIAKRDFSFDLSRECRRIVEAFSVLEVPDWVDYVNALGRALGVAMTSANHLPKSNGKSERGWTIAEMTIGGYFAASAFLAVFRWSHLNGTVIFSLEESHKQKYALLYGSGTVYDRMYDSNRRPISDSPLANYAHDLKIDDSPHGAERYAVGYIRACCSPEGRAIDPAGCSGIGGHIHLAKVTADAGFEWIVQPK
jgi:hypothetical protein